MRGLDCIVFGCGERPIQFAHINFRDTGHCKGKKASDEFSDPLCAHHHHEQTTWPLGIADWYMVRVNMPNAKDRYAEWEKGNK